MSAPVTETTNTGTPEASFEGLIPAASGNLAGGPARPSAPLSEYPAIQRSANRAGSGRARHCFFPRQALRAPHIFRLDPARLRLVLDILGDIIGVACLFFLLFAGLFWGSIQ